MGSQSRKKSRPEYSPLICQSSDKLRLSDSGDVEVTEQSGSRSTATEGRLVPVGRCAGHRQFGVEKGAPDWKKPQTVG
jgi:hypothetical protein